MGSFDFTCAISKLPIKDYEEVKFLLLNKNPKDRRFIVRFDDLWTIRNFPIQAKYNSYGSIDCYDDDKIFTDLILKSFKEDLIEINSDEYTLTKDSSFEQFLQNLRHGKIEIISSVLFGSVTSFVMPAMIRNDIWQKLLTLKNGFIFDNFNQALSFMRNGFEKTKKILLEKENHFKVYKELKKIRQENDAIYLLCSKNGPFDTLYDSFIEFSKLEHSKEDEESFIKNAAETVFIKQILESNRFCIQPSYNCGGQSGNFKNHYHFLNALSSVAKTLIKK